MTLIEAIARIEGFYIPNSRPQRNNNPGDLEYGAFAKLHGADRIEEGTPHPRFAHFPTAEMGFAALHALLTTTGYYTLTIEQAINKYAPPSENNTTNYVQFVCEKVGCKPTDTVQEVLG